MGGWVGKWVGWKTDKEEEEEEPNPSYLPTHPPTYLPIDGLGAAVGQGPAAARSNHGGQGGTWWVGGWVGG